MNSQGEVDMDQLAIDWWVLHRGGGLRALEFDIGSSLYEWMGDVDDRVDAIGADRRTLGGLVESLVTHAKDDSELSYIGTWVLEDAIHAFGTDALQIVDRLELSSRVRDTILAGVAPALRGR